MQTASKSWMITLVGALFFAYHFVQMSLFNPLSAQIMEAFSLSVEQFGSISSSYFLAVAIMAFPAGVLTDKYSCRSLMLTLLAITTATLLVLPHLTDAVSLGALRFCQGLVHAFSVIVCMKLASQWIPPQRMAIASSLIISIGLIGGGLSQPFIAAAQQTFGWHAAVYGDAALGVMIWLLFWCLIRDNPTHRANAPQWGDYIRGLKISLGNKQNWLGGVYICLLNLPIILLGTVWGGAYLESTWQISEQASALIVSMMFLGMVIGGPLAGILSDMIQSRRIPLVAGTLFSALVIGILLMGVSLSGTWLAVLFFLAGVTTSSQVVVYPVIVEDNPLQFTGSAMSIVTFMLMAGNSMATMGFGWILSRSTESMGGGAVLYSVDSFNGFMWAMMGFIMLSLIFVQCMKETFGQHPQ